MVFEKLANAFRLLALRSSGATVETGARLGRRVRCGGPVTIGADAIIGDDVALNGEVKIGRGAHIEKHVTLHGNVVIGEGSVIGAFSILSTLPKGQLAIGRDVYVNAFSVIGAAERVEIADHCIFAAYVQITDATHQIEDVSVLTKHAPIRSDPVHIGENVWLGSGAMVTMGVSIGQGAVIGAKALVTRDVPAMSVAYGVPARVVRSRTTGEGVAT